MAGGSIVNTVGAKDYNGKMTIHVFLTCLVAATGGLIFGYDIGISGTLFPSLLVYNAIVGVFVLCLPLVVNFVVVL